MPAKVGVMRAPKEAASFYALVILCLLAGCSSSPAAGEPSYRAHADHVLGTGQSVASLIVEPDQGVRPLVREIDGAQHTVFVESYILTEKHVVRALERAVARGVMFECSWSITRMACPSIPTARSNFCEQRECKSDGGIRVSPTRTPSTWFWMTVEPLSVRAICPDRLSSVTGSFCF